MEITPAMKSYFDNRTKHHIELVNYFAKKLGKEYPNHDMDKFEEGMYEPYIIYSWSFFKKIELSDEDMKLCNDVTIKHILNNKHHPEYWEKDKSKYTKFSRKNPNCNTVAYDMDKESIIEMVCDWCAMSKEHHNDPFNWFEENGIGRWTFTEEQKSLIFKTMNDLWTGEG